MRYWLRFTKENLQQYISHRDVLKVMTRTMKRAGIPIGFSQGFNPHALLSFSTPLELGVASTAEYMDIQLTQELKETELIELFNNHLPRGFKVLSCLKVTKKVPKLMAWLERGVYKIQSSCFNEGLLSQIIGDINKQDEIIITKRSKRSTKQINAKEMFSDLIAVDSNTLQVSLQTGQKGNLKVSQFIEVMELASGIKLPDWKSVRVELLGEYNGELISPEKLLMNM